MRMIQDDKEVIEIMIVDDTPEHIQVATALLQEFGYKIRIANNGQTALKLVKQHSPTLMLLDIQMPGLDGFEVCKILKSEEKWQDIAIIFMTASNDVASIQRGFELGAQDYVIKPFNAVEFIARINNHIKMAKQARKLKKSYEELNKFCYTVSHDLKSPLHVIKQITELLVQGYESSLSEDGVRLLGFLGNKSDEVIRMVESLLEFSRMCDQEINWSIIDMNQLVDEVMNELRLLEPKRPVNYTREELPQIKGDPLMIKLLIQNGLSNALKFTREKEMTKIHMGYREESDRGIFTIQDNGAGFDMQFAEKLFRVFQRLHATEAFEGSGVGLATIQRIMERHEGRAWIEGKVNEGATLSLMFPQQYILK